MENSDKSKLDEEKDEKKVDNENKPPGGIIGCLYRVCGWFRELNANACQQRKLYRKEGNYTVADYVPEDAHMIKLADFPIIWILAAPGTPLMALVNRLADTYNLFVLNVGALLQKEIALGTNRTDEVHHLMHRGVAIPRAFIFEMVRRQMANVCKRKEYSGFILTEYPSTFSQARDFYNHICKPDFILYIRFTERLTLENIYIYLKFQVRASKVLRKLHPDIKCVAIEQNQKFKRDIQRISQHFSSIFKIVDASMSPEEVCCDIMKWIERSAVLHNVIPPLFAEPPLGEHNV